MNRVGGRLFLLILVSNLLAYFFLVGYGMLSFPAAQVMGVYLWPWTLTRALAGMADLFMPVTVSAVLLGFSFVFVPGIAGAGRMNFASVASSSIALFLLLAAIFTVLAEGIIPGALIRLEEMRSNSSFADGSLEKAHSLLRLKQYEEALLYFDYYLAIDPENEEVREGRAEAEAALELEPSESSMASAGDSAAGDEGISGRLLDQDAGELVETAQNFLNRRDYYSAHNYADIALQLDPTREDARRIASEAWNMINDTEFNRDAAQAGELYRSKREAYTELKQGNTLGAYYRFKELQSKYPLDADIATFLAEALERARKDSFFIEELDRVASIPGRNDIFFVNRFEKNLRELIFFRRLIPAGSLAYVYDAEIIGIDPDGAILYHISAPLGKILAAEPNEKDGDGNDVTVGTTLMLRAIHRDREGVVYEPTFYAGEGSLVPAGLRPLGPSIRTLPGFSLRESSVKLQRIHELLALRPGYAVRGYHPGAVEIELIMRFMRPFGLVIFGYMAIALGWMLRLRGPRRWYHLLLLPILPLMVFLASDFYLFTSRLIYLYFLLQAGFVPTLVLMVILQAVLLTGVLILVAGQSTHETS